MLKRRAPQANEIPLSSRERDAKVKNTDHGKGSSQKIVICIVWIVLAIVIIVYLFEPHKIALQKEKEMAQKNAPGAIRTPQGLIKGAFPLDSIFSQRRIPVGYGLAPEGKKPLMMYIDYY